MPRFQIRVRFYGILKTGNGQIIQKGGVKKKKNCLLGHIRLYVWLRERLHQSPIGAGSINFVWSGREKDTTGSVLRVA